MRQDPITTVPEFSCILFPEKQCGFGTVSSQAEFRRFKARANKYQMFAQGISEIYRRSLVAHSGSKKRAGEKLICCHRISASVGYL